MNKLANILQKNTSCLSTQALIQYHTNKLSRAEQYTVEKHLAECESCSDRLEGLSYLSNVEALPKMVEELTQIIDKKHTRKRAPWLNGRVLSYFLEAVAVLLVFVGGYWVFNQLQLPDITTEELAEQLTKPAHESEAIVSEEKNDESDTVFTKNQKNKPPVSDDKPSRKRKQTKTDFVESYLTDDTSAYLATTDDDFVVVDKDTDDEMEIIVTQEETNETNQEIEIEAELTEEEPTIAPTAGTLSRAKKSTSQAKNLTDRTLLVAIEYYNEKQYAKAARVLDSLQWHENHTEYYQLIWYKALVYKELNRKEKAIEYLQYLKKTNNPYRKKARKLLKSISEN